jgi:uncharacterized protein YggE
MYMTRVSRRLTLLGAALGVALLAAPVASLAQTTSTAGTIVLSGQGDIGAAPDQATITLGVFTQGETAAQALAENTARLTSVFGVLDAAGIEGRDRQTSGLSINPIWEHQRGNNPPPPTIVGYTVSNNVTVRVRDLDALGGVLDAVVRDGANNFQGLSFGVEDSAPLIDEARRAAVADALRKAELYADALGVDLGNIVSVSESGGMRPMMMRGEAAMMMSDGAAPVPIAGGEVTFNAQVSITWELD